MFKSAQPGRIADHPQETAPFAHLVGFGGPEAGATCNTAELANPLSGFCPPGRQFDGFAKTC